MSIKKDFFAPWSKGLGATRRAAVLLLVMMLTAATAWAGTVDVTVNVTGSGSVSIGNQTATAGNPFTTPVDDGASVTLTFAPDAGNIVTGAKLSYKTSEYGSTEGDITVSGSTATFQMPNDIWNGTGVTINVTFGDGIVGGADEASAVALTDATVSNLAGGYYKVESDISFDHTLNLIGDTYLVIASGAKMTVSSSERGINGGSYALNVLGEGTLNVTTTGSYKIAVSVSSYTQLGCSVNLTTTYIGMRCSDSFNISGGSFKTNGSEGIWPDNAVNISGGKLEASNIDANINLSYSNTDDYIKVDNYTSGKTMTIANGQTFTDGTTNYSGTITNLSPLNGKKLFPFVYTHLTVRDATCTEVGIKQECWQRSSDGKYFSDANGTTELNTSDVEIPMIAHNGVRNDATDTHIEYWQCSVCSKYFSNSDCTTEITEEETKIYRTIAIDDAISSLVTSNVDKAVAGTTVTLTVSHLINASTLQVNGGSVTLTDAGNRTYTFTVPAADVTVTASTATTYSVNLPANMEIVSATTTADGDGKYISGTVVTFKASFSYTASNVSDGANTLTADGSGNYSVTVGTADITVTATIGHSSNIDLSQAPSDFTVVDGDVLTGSTSHTVTIANNAKITLSGVTITGGIVCAGTAEITLVGENAVGVTSLDGTLIYQTAGIQIGGSGTTLTIKGNGSLNATGGSASAGIGLGRTWDANATGGSVVIKGGIVNASGGNGIGTGTVGNNMTATIGDIIIKGGTVNARLGKGTINNGSTATIGAIKIYDTIDKVDASKITESVTYMHVDGNTETDVTASASTYFTIIEDGDRRIIEKKDNTDYSITITDNTEHGTIECTATTAKYGDKVTITTTSDFGYRFDHLIVKDADNNDVASTGNSFFMPKSNVTVSAVFEEGTHGTTEFAWGYFGPSGFVREASIYDGLTTVNLQQGQSYQILKYDEYSSYSKFLLDNDTYEASIPYAGGTGEFQKGNGTGFNLDYNGETGYYDITMTDAGNGKWSVSILKTVGQMDVVPDQTYTGSAITPEPLVIAGSLNLTKGTDYVYSYTNNTNVGTAKVRATFQDNYASLGYVEKEFAILPSTVMVNVTGSGTVTYNDRSATDGTSFGVMSEKGASVVLTLAPTDGYAARSVAYGYTNNSGTTASGIKLPISGTTATLTVPDDLKDGTGVTVTVTFAPALNGGADEASAVALTDATVTDLGGGWYKVENDISFDHTLNLLADTYLTIAEGKTMSVNTTSGKAIDSEYTLNVSGEGALNITTTEAYMIAVRVGSYVQTGATVTASGYIGIRCTDSFGTLGFDNDFTFSGGQLTATGSGGDGIWADNDITLSCTNATDFILASSYDASGTVKVADGKALTDGTEASNGMNGYSGTLTGEQRTAIGGKTLHRAVTTSYVDASGTLHENVIAIPLDNTMTTLAAGWYVVNSDVDYTGTVTLSGDVTLILADGCQMSATTIDGSEKLLTVYAQTEQTGQMVAAAYECGVALGQRFVAYNMASEGDISATAVVSGTISDVKTIAGKTLRPIAGHLVATPAGVAITGKTSPDFTITTGAGTESEATTSYYIISAYNTVTLSYAGSDFVMLSGLPEGTTLAAVAGQPMQRTFTMPATDVVLTATPVTGLTASGTYTYDGQQQTPAISLNESAFEATNYTVSSVAPKADSSSQLTDGKAVNAGEYSVTITGLGQYVGTTSVDFTINPKPVTIATVDVNDKVYDGTTNATLSGTASFVDGMVVEGDEVSISVSGASAVFADRYVGDNKDATVTGLALAGGSKDNYTLTAQQASAKASIKPAPVTVKADDKSKEWGTADDPELTATVTGMAAGEDLSLISYTIARVKGEFSDSKENSGEYTITPTGEATQGNYAVTYETGKFTIKGKPVTIQDVEGHDVSSVDNTYTITQDQNGVTLTLIVPDETTTPSVDIPVAVEVDHVVIDRLFASGKAATVYLPFSIEVSKIGGGTFHTFGIVDETTTPLWTVTYSAPLANDATLQAGTPYIFMPDGSNGGKIVVNNGNDKINICTATQHTTTQGLWEFKGTYEPIVWLSNPAAVGYNAQRAAEIGYVYGFAAEEKTFGGKDYTVGQFVKIGSGASIDPNRAYLKRNVDQQAPALGGSDRTAVELPSAMRVVILSANSTTGIVEMRNENEEMRNDTWHTLGGRRLQGKPSGRGMYIHNGRKEVIR